MLSAGGMVLHNCTVAPHPDLIEVGTAVRTYLGRLWKEYSRTIYLQCQLGVLVDPVGWLPWNNTNFAFDTLFLCGDGQPHAWHRHQQTRQWDGIRNVT
jgi:pectinesterase